MHGKKKQTNKCTVKQALCPRIFNLDATGSKVCEYSNEVAKSTLEAVSATAKKLKGLVFFCCHYHCFKRLHPCRL